MKENINSVMFAIVLIVVASCKVYDKATVSGIYVNTDLGRYDKIELVKTGYFKYYPDGGSLELSYELVKGKWIIVNNHVILESYFQPATPNLVVAENQENTMDSLIIRIYGMDTIACNGGHVALYKNGEIVGLCETNIDGICKTATMQFDSLVLSTDIASMTTYMPKDTSNNSFTFYLKYYRYIFFTNEKWKIKEGQLIEPGTNSVFIKQ